MQAKIFTTSSYGEFIQDEVYAGEPLSGVKTLIADKNSANSEFMGFGVAATGSSCWNLTKLSDGERKRVLGDLYSPDGLNFNICRLSIGASDYSAEVYSYDDVSGDEKLEHFSIEKDKKYIIPILKEIKEINPDIKFFAAPWSPPGWMKVGGSIGGGFMRRKYVECYAEYFVKFVLAYENEGIPIYAVTAQNEPFTQQAGTMPACIWDPEVQAEFVNVLRKKFDNSGIKTQIWFHDHNFISASQIKWCFDEYSELVKNCNGVAFHYYEGAIEETLALKEQYPSLALHFTEGGPRLFDNYATDWCKWTLMAVKALSCGYSSFTGWNLMLDQTGGPNVGPFFCGGLITRDFTDNSLSYSGQYKAFRHLANIKKGSVIYPLSVSTTGNCMAAYPNAPKFQVAGCENISPSGQTSLILVNPTAEKAQLQYKYNGEYYYISLLADSVATVVFEN